MKPLTAIAFLLSCFGLMAADINITNVTKSATVPPGSYGLGTTGLVTRLLPFDLFPQLGASQTFTGSNTFSGPVNIDTGGSPGLFSDAAITAPSFIATNSAGFIGAGTSLTGTAAGLSIGGNAATAGIATNVPGTPIIDLSLCTNLSSGSFRFSLPSVTSGATNWIIDLGPGKGIYKTIHATNDICFLYCTNGPGVCSIKIYPDGADRTISIPTNWMPYQTNSWVINGTYWSRVLTNTAGTVGPRIMTLSVRNETASTQTNTDWGYMVTTP